jgi:four helix bundle protein
MKTTLEELDVYQLSFSLAMKIFEVTKGFPKEEMYSLTNQIRRSSRSVTANISEAYRKRQYPAHFVSKLSDADMENTETQTWLNFSKDCNYLTLEDFNEFLQLSEKVGRILGHMIRHPAKFTESL